MEYQLFAYTQIFMKTYQTSNTFFMYFVQMYSLQNIKFGIMSYTLITSACLHVNL